MQKILIISSYQFGYLIDTYYWCKYLSRSFNVSYIGIDRGLPKRFLNEVNVSEINRKSIITAYIDFYKLVINSINSDIYYRIILVAEKGSIIIPLFSCIDNVIFDIRTVSVNLNCICRFIENVHIFLCVLTFKRINVIDRSVITKYRISLKKVQVVPLGAECLSLVDEHEFQTLNLLYVGTFYGRNIDLTIDAFSKFLLYSPNSVYHIIGSGRDIDNQVIMETISRLGVSKSVFYHGYLPHDDCSIFFDNCNVGVSFIPFQPCYDKQPPTKTYEYLLSGMCCIATNTSANRRLITSNNGILIDDTINGFLDGLLYLYSNRSLFKSAEIKKDARKYHWENIVNEYLLNSF